MKNTGIRDRVDIEHRPVEANNRERIGDWEGDTIIGKNHKGAIIKLFEPIKDFVLTLTMDNEKEFAYHSDVSDKLNCDTYLAKPYHSWERGQNENANGLLRQYFPKSVELIDVAKQQVFDAIHKLNSRPLKCLGYKTPYEVFEELTGISQKELTVMYL